LGERYAKQALWLFIKVTTAVSGPVVLCSLLEISESVVRWQDNRPGLCLTLELFSLINGLPLFMLWKPTPYLLNPGYLTSLNKGLTPVGKPSRDTYFSGRLFIRKRLDPVVGRPYAH